MVQKTAPLAGGVTITRPVMEAADRILTRDALEFLAELHRRFNPVRLDLLRRRDARYAELRSGKQPDFLRETRSIREGTWSVAPAPADLQDRRVEITGPTDAKMLINALNSGARVYMADFEDANTPTWTNLLEGQANLVEAIEGRLQYTSPEGKEYRLRPPLAILLVRPRGWHLSEKHVQVDGAPMSGSLFDFGLYVFHNAKRLGARGTGPYFYLPKIESHLEARLWNDVFDHTESRLNLSPGSIKATVLIETVLAAFEMEEILHELRTHSSGLNAGRWDYLFSIIKKFRHRPDLLLPDRAQLTMTVPFMRAYTELLVATCHRRGAHAIGGMAAYIPSRKDPEVNETALAKVREDKVREANDGFDGTWVAHPDLVPLAQEEFDRVLGDRANQVARKRDDVRVSAADLLRFQVPGGTITEAGLGTNVSVGIRYVESWLRGVGAAAIDNLMEDTATAEISRSQVWLWVRRKDRLSDGPAVTPQLVRSLADQELEKIRNAIGPERWSQTRFPEAREIFERVALGSDYPDFLTLIAYERID